MPRQRVMPPVREPSYIPRAGSIAARALEYLLEHGETAAGPLADAIDVALDSLYGGLSYAISNGLIATERKSDGLHWYRVGDNVPLTRDQCGEEWPDPEPIIRRLVPASSGVTGSDLAAGDSEE